MFVEPRLVGKNAAAEGTEQDVFHRGFVGALVTPQEAGHDVKTKGHGFQTEEQNNEVVAGGHEHHADARKEKQGIILAFLLVLQIQVTDGQKDHESRGGKKENGEDDEETIDDNGVMKTKKSRRGHGVRTEGGIALHLHE